MTSSQPKTVVIGAGIGGLSAAVLLAQAGHHVRVVEAAAAPGGKMRQIPSAAGPVDAGPTVMTMKPIFDRLFAEAGARLEDYVTLDREPLLARHFWPDGSRLDLYDDVEASTKAVSDFAGPREARAFQRFTDRCRTLFDGFEAPMMRTPAPTPRGLASHVARHPHLALAMAPLARMAGLLRREFRDPRLRQLFGRYATYVGGSPFRAPALLSLIWASEAAGVWRVRGGMHALARAVADLAADRGAEFHYEARAESIERQGGRVAAVRLADGTRLAAETVLFNGDPKALSDGLLGSAFGALLPKQATAPRSYSAYVWSFAATPMGAPLAHHNVFFARDSASEFRDLDMGHMPRDPTLYVCAQDRGDTAKPEGLERFEIIMNGPAGAPVPTEEVAQCKVRTFETLAASDLSFSPSPGRESLTTPAHFAAMFPGSDGSLYGRSPHGMMAAFQRPTHRTGLAGLYLAGGGVHPGAGVPMASLSGQHAAATIMQDHALTSPSPRTVTPGGMSTGSAPMGAGRSRSSVLSGQSSRLGTDGPAGEPPKTTSA